MAQTLVSTCAATACSFNNGGCTVAMTMGERGCATFAKLDARRSVAANGLVGACQRLECVRRHRRRRLRSLRGTVAAERATRPSAHASVKANDAGTPRTRGPRIFFGF